MDRSLSLTPTVGVALLLLAACSSGAPQTTGTSGTGGATSSSSTSGSGGTGGSVPAGPTTVATDKGSVQGILEGDTRAFLGIPYAAPPVGPLRWRPPHPAAAWTGVADASKKGPACPQLLTEGTSEDCLTLNVWTPRAASTANAPVMVWLHGGGFTTGSGGDPAFDGQSLSEATGAVIVTLNYRLGPLGYLAHAALDAEDPAHPTSGNYGHLDQQAALGWVKANIAGFGGDPGDVTLFGESAGGISTCLHLVTPSSAGLFHRAIIESGPCGLSNGTRATQEKQGDDVAAALGCTVPATVLTCMRGKTQDEVLMAVPLDTGEIAGDGVSWLPYGDGVDIPGLPQALLEAGSFTKLPVILGTNKNEGTLFFALAGDVTDEASYLAVMDRVFFGNGAAIVARYPGASFPSLTDAAAEAFGDGAFVCPTRRAARALVKGGAATYLYQYVHPASTGFLTSLGVFHSSEVPLIFGNTYLGIVLDGQEEMLSKEMRGFWLNHAKTGSPGTEGTLAWPAYALPTESNMVLDLQVSTATALKGAICDFWDGITP
jgi:para-nitrobenzyl esterase